MKIKKSESKVRTMQKTQSQNLIIKVESTVNRESPRRARLSQENNDSLSFTNIRQNEPMRICVMSACNQNLASKTKRGGALARAHHFNKLSEVKPHQPVQDVSLLKN